MASGRPSIPIGAGGLASDVERVLDMPLSVQRRGGMDIDLLPNHQIEPTRQVACAITSPRRAAHLER
jgi:hypothetical protein